MPALFGKSSKQADLIAHLPEEFLKVQKAHQLAFGDFPDVERFRSNLKIYNMTEFNKLSPKLVAGIDEVLSVDLPKLMQLFPQGNPSVPSHLRNPFAESAKQTVGSSPDESADLWLWESVEVSKYTLEFNALHPVNARISGEQLKPVMVASELPVQDLSLIWTLADLTKDGYMDLNEFCLAMHLMKIRKLGMELPKVIPVPLMPK